MTVGSFLTNPGNYQKTPIGGSLNRLARQNVGTAIQQHGDATIPAPKPTIDLFT